jgi:hypothetical protein
MKKHNSEDIYNVNKYSDVELFQILDLINPSDREFEAKIIQMMNKYQTIKNDSGSQLYRFFNDIYNHFFESSDDDVENMDTIVEGLDERKFVFSGKEGEPNSVTQYDGSQLSGNLFSVGNSVSSGTSTVAKTIDVNTDYRKSDVSLTKPLDYSKDVLNPLLKQTVRRIISIDSSYRPNIKDLATDFTFNLSDPLRDVLSLKLYSVQIPYSWYTISKQYGSNFFYLKGNSDGINNGSHDYQIKIDAGNYTQTLLVQAINASIQAVVSKNTDVDFGNTAINYNLSTQLATFNLDITKLYNESNYYLYFPNWTTPINEILRNDSIPGFLGYNYTEYIPSAICSARRLPLSPTVTTDSDYTQSIFNIDTSNNFFTIKQYDGYDEYSSTSRVYQSYDISFNTTYILNGSSYSRQSLYNDINTQLQNNPYLINSYIERVDISNVLLDGCGNSFYKMFIQLNPKTTPNIKNSKTIVIFPDESYNNNNHIWTGIGSCFSFDNLQNEISNVLSETQSLQTNYIIDSIPYIYLKCINTDYNKNNDNNYTKNDYQINISNSSITGGYTLDEYIGAINNAFVIKNQTTITSKNPNGDFNMPGGNDYVNSYTNVVTNDSTDSKIRFRFDVNKTFDETKYTVNFRNTDLSNILHFPTTKADFSNNIPLYGKDLSNNIDGAGQIDLSGVNIFRTRFRAAPGYTIDSSFLMIIKPKLGYGNQNATEFKIPPVYTITTKTYTSLKQMESDMNLAFTRFTDKYGDFVLSGTNILLDNVDGTINATLTIKVKKILTQNDYHLFFNDPNSPNGWSRDVSNSWYNFLKIPDASFNLKKYLVKGESYGQILGESAIYGNQIILNDASKNNYFYIKPLSTANGVYTENNTNDIRIDIPYATYTRSQLINAINTKLSDNPLTQGSSVSVFTKNTIEYTKFRVNINKIFTANDYRLVFYYPYSFVKCYVGSKSAKNTTWDSTLGWVLGFRSLTEYNLLKSNEEVDPNDDEKIYYIGTSSYYSTDATTNVVSITGDTAVNVNLYNYFLIVLDDYTQSHLNDGLVTITSSETDIPLPSYASRQVTTCDPIDKTQQILFTGNSTESGNVNTLTQKEIYATNEKIASRKNKSKSYSSGPFVKDIFGLVPMKTSGLQNGSTYIEFGGTLQNQDRTYFGPVNIHRMSVKLMNERGDVVDLNGSNWSFSLMCEQLYQQKSL